MRTAIIARVFVFAALAGCGDSSDSEASHANDAGPADPSADPRDAFPGRFCEIFVGYPAESPGLIDFEIWGSQSLGNCPQAAWEALDFDAIQAELGAVFVLPNGPRAILADFGGGVAFGENVRSFGDIDMQVVSYLRDFDPSEADEETPYRSSLVEQEGEKGFSAGREVYELITDEGDVFTLVTVDLNVISSVEDLPGLGARLTNLPDGWVWQATVLDADRRIEANGALQAMRDELGNTYQRAADPVADPRDDIPGRYCEILLGYLNDEGLLSFEIWGSQFVGDCPQAKWDALDFEAIRTEYEALFINPNGPRAGITDFGGDFEGVGEEIRVYGGIQMQLVSTIPSFDPSMGGGGGYTLSLIDQTSVKGYNAGSEVYELLTDDGRLYTMVTVDLNNILDLSELPGVGARLENLPAGWTWQATVLDAERRIEVDGNLESLQDELGNTYQRAGD
ncbi:MAG: hypothetical protein AAF447_11555 [Myxococcota bacterium]